MKTIYNLSKEEIFTLDFLLFHFYNNQPSNNSTGCFSESELFGPVVNFYNDTVNPRSITLTRDCIQYLNEYGYTIKDKTVGDYFYKISKKGIITCQLGGLLSLYEKNQEYKRNLNIQKILVGIAISSAIVSLLGIIF